MAMSQTKFREFITLAKQIGNELRRMIEKLDLLRAEIQRLIHDAVSIPIIDKQSSDKGNDAPKNHERNEPIEGTVTVGAAPQFDPSIRQTGSTEEPHDERSDKILWFIKKWKEMIEVIGVLAIIAYTILTYSESCTMREANRLTQETLELSQRAYVTIGRKDGVVGDFVVPKDPSQNAEIVIYFQNSGRLPAKFAWGTMLPFLSSLSGQKSTGITYTHPFKGLQPRRRDKKTGSIGESGESDLIAGDSIYVATLGAISQKDLAAFPENGVGLAIFGVLQYCDGFGNFFSRNFILGYRSGAPSADLGFYLVGDTPGFPMVLPKPTASVEYLSPCENPNQR
jgi:hypothetical protein